MDSSNQFWQFSDNLRLQTNNLANLSLNDSIWSTNYTSKRPVEERQNFDIRVGGELNSVNLINPGSVGLNGGFNKGIYSSPSLNFNKFNKGKNVHNTNVVVNGKANKGGKNDEENGHSSHGGGKIGKKNKNNKDNTNNNNNGENKSASDKRFKTLPPSESLPRNETVGGYIFVCNNDTMQENLNRQLFGLPPRYRDSVRAITPGLPLFLYNYSTHQLHGIFEAASFGGTNIDPTAWEDKKNPGESRFPAQVRVVTRKVYEPLEEDSFRPILHHYDGPKFRLELNVPEAISLLDIFAENDP
ncbi:unnamed protein product [Fraxinus pennsylvanica]|uniref:DCD domain-containing protein n=1 Tax=Fraxinus pennsylvanica TaxID=56036 RepID=A0AAD2DLU3_9LAMI|nr:unnamed protein product [Fraxinus pennsylvanica]